MEANPVFIIAVLKGFFKKFRYRGQLIHQFIYFVFIIKGSTVAVLKLLHVLVKVLARLYAR